MSSETATSVGQVATLWRYPIKSMLGEELPATQIAGGALLGDRAFALVDSETGKVASAKNPRKWPELFDFRATFTAPLKQSDFDLLMSKALKREVLLSRTSLAEPHLEEFWPEVEGITYNNVVTDEAMPSNTFFDLAPIHILTTSTIDRLRALYPQGRFEARRFRPNIVVKSEGQDFVENAWVGRTLAIGEDVLLSVTSACPRCVMTTLAQGACFKRET